MNSIGIWKENIKVPYWKVYYFSLLSTKMPYSIVEDLGSGETIFHVGKGEMIDKRGYKQN